MNTGPDDRYAFRYSLDAPCEPAATICHAVAWIRSTSVTDLEPLGRTIDSVALNELFAPPEPRDDPRRSTIAPNLTVTFEYESLVVTVEPERIAID